MMGKYLNYFSGESIDYRERQFNNFEIRCYFDNDSDELINHKSLNGQVDLEVYRMMLRDLKAMGYNAVDIHDQLGRPEFYLWESYTSNWDFEPSIDHINDLIDLIHEEGMLVQIPMYLGWAFHPLNDKHECYSKYKQDWLDTWKFYMESPLGNGDIFLLRPRSPIYDCEYRCDCPECVEKGTGAIMTEIFDEIEKIILSKNPSAKLICDLYAEGHDLFINGTFTVSDKWLLLYADSGYGNVEYDYFKTDTPHKKGIYVHAGFWLNHTLQDPHVDPLIKSIKRASKENMDSYILVNGQSFKNFILNLELIMDVCAKCEQFDKIEFFTDYFKRLYKIKEDKAVELIHYVDKLAEFYRLSSKQTSYLTNEGEVDRGYQAILMKITYPLIELINSDYDSLSTYSQEALPFDKETLDISYNDVVKMYDGSVELYKKILDLCNSVEIDRQLFFIDQFVFPQKILMKTLRWTKELYSYLNGESNYDNVIITHQKLINLVEKGSGLDGFETWYHIKRSRQHHPIPKINVIYNK